MQKEIKNLTDRLDKHDEEGKAIRESLEKLMAAPYGLENSVKGMPVVDIDTIHNWEDIARAWNIDPVKSLPRPEPKDADEENDNAHFMAKKFVALVNNDPKFPNFKDNNENKFNPVFDMSTGSGVGFSRSRCVCWGSLSLVGARLQWKDKDKMFEVFKRPGILAIWNKLMH